MGPEGERSLLGLWRPLVPPAHFCPPHSWPSPPFGRPSFSSSRKAWQQVKKQPVRSILVDAKTVRPPYLHHAYQYCGSGTTFELPDSCSLRSSMLANRDRNVRDARAVVPLVVPCDILRQRIPSTTPATSQ